MSTPFDFLKAEFPEVYGFALKAGQYARVDPRSSCFNVRIAVESAVKWAFKHDRSLYAAHDDKLSALINEPGFRTQMGDTVYRKVREAIRLGNHAAHDARPLTPHDSVAAVSQLFEFTYWFARTYAQVKPPAGLSFNPRTLPPPPPPPTKSTAQNNNAVRAKVAPQPPQKEQVERIQQLERELEESRAIRERFENELADRAELEAELEKVRRQVVEAKAAAAATPDDHDYSEAQTRDYFIDILLAEAGWDLDQPQDREYRVTGMPEGKQGFVDYVLWGDDGRPLAIVEAKRTRRDATAGQQQAKLYADCLEQMTGQRPLIFYSNGYEHWLWDDVVAPHRRVAGFLTRPELELAIRRRTMRKPLAEVPVDPAIVERYYQTRAIRRIGESFETDHARKALLVMATGAGKTRTVVALADQLIRAGWVKRVLFLADRTALVNQANDVFKRFLPDSAPVNLVADRSGEGRIYLSTYPTMLNLINEVAEGRRRFGPGYFDLVVIDEAHRSVFNKYQAIFDHFDALLVGLTATPRDEVDRSTYRLFDLEEGIPTDAYGIDEAVADGYLVPMKGHSVPLQFQREGIRYADRTDEEKDQWDTLDWDDDGDDDGDPPDAVGAEALNRWLFNADTVDQVLGHVMTNGIKVAGGDRLGKTIIFAKSQDHADFIAQRFDIAYPHLRGSFARVITNRTEQAQSLIDDFSIPEKEPHIAISVDMLDTGIDVPEVVNLVFFKTVRSKTKFWQMLGRGTRLRPDLFGPGQDKEHFVIFDFCQNLEFFSQNPDAADGAVAASLGSRLFTTRLDLLAALDSTGDYSDQRQAIADRLWSEVDAMNVDNVVVRPHRRIVETFAQRSAWNEALDVGAASDLARHVAGLPSGLDPEPEQAKRFDLLALRLQLALLNDDAGFPKLAQQVRDIAHLLEDYPAVPAVAAALDLIHEVQTDEWWVDVTLPMLESARQRLRGLVGFIDHKKRQPLYTDFADALGESTEITFAGLGTPDDFERFRRKSRLFLEAQGTLLAVEKLRLNRPVTATDLDELQRVLVEAGVGSEDDITRAAEEAGGLGVFVRGLVGLDRAAAKEAFAEILDGSTLTGDQIEFVNLVIDHLTQHGVIDARRFYESPFTDVSPTGPDDLFGPEGVDRLVSIVTAIRTNADVA